MQKELSSLLTSCSKITSKGFTDKTVFTLAIAALLVLSLFVGSSKVAHAAGDRPLYNCSNPHCYGEVEWDNRIDGASTNVIAEFIKCGTCDGFINNEIWLQDAYESNCVNPDNNSAHNCWVEAGYTTYGSIDYHESPPCVQAPANCYFWADNRPGKGYYEHPVGNIPSSDYGYGVYLFIDLSGTNTYKVEIGAPSATYYGSSTLNSMAPNYITMGEELYGTGGASSPYTNFTYNAWYSSQNNTLHYQATVVNPTYNSPPYATWSQKPSGTNYGGNLQTWT